MRSFNQSHLQEFPVPPHLLSHRPHLTHRLTPCFAPFDLLLDLHHACPFHISIPLPELYPLPGTPLPLLFSWLLPPPALVLSLCVAFSATCFLPKVRCPCSGIPHPLLSSLTTLCEGLLHLAPCCSLSFVRVSPGPSDFCNSQHSVKYPSQSRGW